VPAAGNAVSFEELTLSEEIADLVTKQFSYFDLMSLLRHRFKLIAGPQPSLAFPEMSGMSRNSVTEAVLPRSNPTSVVARGNPKPDGSFWRISNVG
jgi:hypothetical protein